jgi:hypothetical protein
MNQCGNSQGWLREDPGLKPLLAFILFQGPEGPCSLRFALSREGEAD